MRNTFLMSIAAGAACASVSEAQFGRAVSSDAADDSFSSESFTISGGVYNGNAMLGAPGWTQDMFGITEVSATNTLDNLPNAIGDISTLPSPFGPGFLNEFDGGVIKSGDEDRFFGVVSNGDGGRGPSSATWTFDISGATGTSISVDMAAFGDFVNPSDTIPSFTASIDGGTAQSVFSFTNTGGPVTVSNQNQQENGIFSGTSSTFSSPLTVDGAALTTDFATFTTGQLGVGATLTLTFTAELNDRFASADAFAFRNIVVNELPIPAPGVLALAPVAGVLFSRRRRV
ncbi:MAG: hypothetical protein AAGI30_05660 [Planctomycetota bacterium]